jgi:hypothetical protein
MSDLKIEIILARDHRDFDFRYCRRGAASLSRLPMVVLAETNWRQGRRIGRRMQNICRELVSV